MSRFHLKVLAGLVLAFGLASTASAHPHIFVDAKATLVFNDAGELAAIRHSWSFDEAFSVWQVQGLDTDGDGTISPEEMQELADENVEGLAAYDFYTSAGEANTSVPFASMGDARFVFQDNRSTLTYTIAPQQPYRIGDRLEIAIADPEYYVAIGFDSPAEVTLENAPAGCAFHMQPGRELSPDLQARLFELPPDVTKLPPDLEFALRGAQGVIVLDCSAGAAPREASTALEAATNVAEAKPAMPFGGPPPEPGFAMPRTGFLGWVGQMQSDFYRALTAALGQLKADSTAFWVLGGLSFLYGVFHAAGPGHGKVVIGSYMLANERQVRRGIALSFAAALMQSVVAVVFVGVAAAILGLSSIAMGAAVGWIETVSYGLVALLGLWLLGRKLFGWGPSHKHEATDLRAKARAHLDDEPRPRLAEPAQELALQAAGSADAHHGHHHAPHAHSTHGQDHHHHVVAAGQTGGDWREQLGVVLGVGLRPCSGALVVLVFALSQGILPAGIAAVFLMGLGTAVTVATLAVLAVSAKDFASRTLGSEGRLGGRIVWWAELAGALVVFGFGAVLLLASL